MLGAAFLGLAVLVKVVIAFMVAGAAVALVLCDPGQAVLEIAAGVDHGGHHGLCRRSSTMSWAIRRGSGEYFLAWTVELLQLITSPHFYADWLGFVGSLVGLSILFISLVGTALASPRFRSLLLGLWIGYLLYGLVLPFQMFTHSYYHLQLVPVIALGLVPVAEALVRAGATACLERWRIAAMIPLLALARIRILGGALHTCGRGLLGCPEVLGGGRQRHSCQMRM